MYLLGASSLSPFFPSLSPPHTTSHSVNSARAGYADDLAPFAVQYWKVGPFTEPFFMVVKFMWVERAERMKRERFTYIPGVNRLDKRPTAERCIDVLS